MVLRAPKSFWTIDPADPRAPPDDVWDAMTEEQRKWVVDHLPSYIPMSEASPPEGDPHASVTVNTREVLSGYFKRTRRPVYIATDLTVYYPNEGRFAPDVIAVLDVEVKPRMSWIIRKEGKGLDFALEIIVAGNRRKDLKDNVERYARLGISEYFVFDRGRVDDRDPGSERAPQLRGYRLADSGARVYKPILAQGGLYPSRVLGLEMRVERGSPPIESFGAAADEYRLRFYHAGAPLPDADEMIARLEKMVDDASQRVSAAEDQAVEEARLREEEAQKRVDLERRLAEALEKIARLEGRLAGGVNRGPEKPREGKRPARSKKS